jgi:membrane protein YqaA with SNARE-associated domain
MSSYVIGRLLPDEKAMRSKMGNKTRGLEWVRQHGAPILFFSWLPLIGDVLCVAAGWLRIHWLWAVIFIAAGKFARYWVIATAIR